MYKFKRGVILILFILSTIFMFVYRSEYLKLRYTFELGGLSNPPALPSDCLVINDSYLKSYDVSKMFAQPQASWKKVNDFYIYSAYMKFVNGDLTGVTYAVTDKKLDCPDYKCHIWYFEHHTTVSHEGEFICNIETMTNSTKLIYEFHCKLGKTEIPGFPNIYVLIDSSNTKFFIPIHYKGNMNKLNNSAVCVYPDTNAIERISIVEFLSFYQTIGFTDVIIYDSGLQHRILYLLERAHNNINFVRSFNVLQWNFPFLDQALTEELVRRDCLYRTSSQVELVTYLRWNEYLVPVNNQSILKSVSHNNFNKPTVIKIKKKVCCIDTKDDPKLTEKSWPLIFRKTVCLSNNLHHDVILNPDVSEELDTVSLPPTNLYINDYALCGDNRIYGTHDKQPLKYLTNLMKCKLMSLWRSGTLIES